MAKPESKDAPKQANPADRHLAQLQAREKNLKSKIADRIPNFSEDRKAEATERAQRHLAEVQALIKAASKTP